MTGAARLQLFYSSYCTISHRIEHVCPDLFI